MSLETSDGFVIRDFEDPQRTRALYDEIRARWTSLGNTAP